MNYYYLYLLLLGLPVILIVFIIVLLLRDDNRIRVSIINRNHVVRKKKVNPNIEYFRDRNSIYMIPSDCVTLSSTKKGLNPKAELYFVEDNPLPINFKPKPIKNEEGEMIEVDANVWITNKITLEMVLANTGKPKSEVLNVILGYLSDPQKLMSLVFVLIIVGALLTPRYVPEIMEMLS